MALTLLALLLGIFTNRDFYFIIAFWVLLLTMIFPKLYYPAAIVWFGLAQALSWVSSRVILTLVFFLLIVPVGLVRRAMGKDPLQRKDFKRGNQSVMKERNHRFTAADIDKPY